MAPLTRRQSKRRQTAVELPDDVIFIILSWLPVTSLLRFKCVSKSWLSLISSSQRFAKAHFSNSSKTHQKLVFCIKGICVLQQSSITATTLQLDAKTVEIIKKIKQPHKDYDYSLVGSSNGLVCLTCDKAKSILLLWNPATNKHKLIPPCPVKPTTLPNTFAFGYDSSADDYKIAALTNVRIGNVEDGTRVGKEVVTVYSLKANQWKRINVYLSSYFRDEPPLFVMGKIYWIRTVFLSDNSCAASLYCFDLETETIKQIFVPEYIHGVSNRYTLTISEQYDIIVLAARRTGASLWKLEGYVDSDGKKGPVWQKMCTLVGNNIDVHCIETKIAEGDLPFHALINGEILLLINGRFMIVNPKDGSFRYSDKIFPVHRVATCTYVESLVSL